MNTRKIALIALLAPAFVGGIASTACSDASALPGLDNIAEQCGLVCAAEGIVEGNAQISGLRSIDTFFAAVVDFNAKATIVSGNIDAQLGRIRAAVGVDANADLNAAIKAKFALYADGGVTIVAQPPKCEVSASATIEATAKCDATVTPGMVSATCSGSCTLDASAMAKCDANATLTCSGTLPDLQCAGTCKAACDGTCMMDGTAKCEGTCSVAPDANGNCNGACTISGEGQCNGKCMGSCKGECSYTPPNGMCTGGAQVKCEAKANVSAECKGKCDATVTPPKASAECEASAKASGEINVECTPPKLALKATFKASLDADLVAKAQYQAFATVFFDAYGQILAEVKRADVVAKAGGNLAVTGKAAVEGAANQLKASADVKLKATIGVGCALAELPKVATSVKVGTDKLTGSIAAAAKVSTAVGG